MCTGVKGPVASHTRQTLFEWCRLQCHPGKSGGHVFLRLPVLLHNVSNLQPVTELGTPKNMAAALPGINLSYIQWRIQGGGGGGGGGGRWCPDPPDLMMNIL